MISKPDVVAILSFDRPEMLALCLERLAAASGIREKQVWVCQDIKPHGPAPETLREVQQVLRSIPLDIRYMERRTSGVNNGENSVLTLREAHATGAERIFFFEDDVLVNPDFFSFCHQALLQFKELPVVCCRGLTRGLVGSRFASDPLSVCITQGSSFKQLAVAFGRENLGTILRSVHPDKTFDGQMEGAFFITPFVSRARDIGRYSSIPLDGNEKAPRPVGTLDEKIAEIKRRFLVEPVVPTKLIETPELVLRLDIRLRQPQAGFKLVRGISNGRFIDNEHWITEELAKERCKPGRIDQQNHSVTVIL